MFICCGAPAHGVPNHATALLAHLIFLKALNTDRPRPRASVAIKVGDITQLIKARCW